MAVRSIEAVAQQRNVAKTTMSDRMVWLVMQICSFETAFVLFLNSDSFEILFFPSTNLTIPLLGLSMGLGGWVLLREGINLKGLHVVMAFLALGAWIIVTYSWTPSIVIAKDRINGLFLVTLWTVIAGALVMANRRERVVRFLAISVIVGVFIAAKGMQVAIELGTVQRFAEDARAHISWGRTVGPAVIVSFAVILFSKPLSIRQLLALGVLATSIGYLLLAGGRGPFLASAVALMVPFMLGAKITKTGLDLPRFQVIGFSAMLLIAIGIGVLAMTSDAAFTLSRLMGTLEKDNAVVGGATRIRYFPAAYDYWLQAPIFGHGIGSFSLKFLGFEQAGAYPHNIFLEIFCELGIVGFVLFLYFAYAASPRATFSGLRNDPLMLTVFMLVIMALMNAMVSSNIAGNRLVFLFLSMMAVRPPPKPD